MGADPHEPRDDRRLADTLAALPARLDEWTAALDVPGASVGVLDGGRRWACASGLVNVETGVEATPDSVFQIGSITKIWTTTLVMQLIDEGAFGNIFMVEVWVCATSNGSPSGVFAVASRG